jgi:RimJ/RimL family protein N-acetyltransferase
MAWLNRMSLTGQNVTLVPLEEHHASALVEAASDGELWDLWYTGIPSATSINDYIKKALDDEKSGDSLPFVVIDNETQAVIGSTRYCGSDAQNNRVEIGYTWYAKRYQRTFVNTECKLLLLTHAFETLSAIAVEFCTGWHNQASRKAIARLGAKQDGILRNHKKLPNGGYRDTVVFSIINSEWLAVKQSLEYKQRQYTP